MGTKIKILLCYLNWKFYLEEIKWGRGSWIYKWFKSHCPTHCLSLIPHLWLKTLLTGHWGGPYGVKVQGSWLSGGCRGNQTKAQPAGPQPHRASIEQWQIPHWGQLPVRFQTKVWSMETGHSGIIRSPIHTPASRVTWSLFNGE